MHGPAMERASKERARATCGRGMAWDERHCSAVHMEHWHGEAAGRLRRGKAALAKRIRRKVVGIKLSRLAVRLSRRPWV